MKTVKLQDIAQKAGVSVSTVIRVIHDSGYVSQEKRQRIEQVIQELGYKGPQKKSVGKENQRLIGLILPDEHNHFFYQNVTYECIYEAKKQGYYVLPVIGHLTNSEIIALVEALLDVGVNGIICTTFGEPCLSAQNQYFLQNCGVPLVFLERAGHGIGMNQILADISEGMYSLVSYLLRLGHEKIAYLGFESGQDVEHERLVAIKNALKEFGKNPDDLVVVLKNEARVQDGYTAMLEALEAEPCLSSVICWSDIYAAGVMQYLHKIRKKVPKDISVIGFDNFIAHYLMPPLTTMENPVQEMLEAAFGLIREQQDPKRSGLSKKIFLTPKLVQRASAAPPGQAGEYAG